MSSGNRQTFFSLVRLGIGHTGGTDITEKGYLSAEDWKKMKTLADEQGLSAIIIDSIEKLSEHQRPSKEQTLQWIGEVLKSYEYRYSDYERAIGVLAGFYNQHGIKMMVLKGYGLGLNYPNPKHRPSGDIDTWNFGKQEEADAIITNELGIPINNSEHHHTIFCWRSYMVENHYDILITTAAKANSQLEPILKELAMDDSNSIDINGETIYLPSANFNALFLLRHMLMHFVACGMNTRNVLDWGFFWEKEHESVDWDWLSCILDKYKMMDFFHIVNLICVEDLGFDKNIFPMTNSTKEYLKDRVLEDIISPEYDWKDAHRLSFFPRIVFKFRRWRAGSWKRRLCYKEGDIVTFLWGIKTHLLKPASI